MRTVALEEHFAVPALSARIAKDVISRRGYRPRNLTPGAPNPVELLPEIGEIRLIGKESEATPPREETEPGGEARGPRELQARRY